MVDHVGDAGDSVPAGGPPGAVAISERWIDRIVVLSVRVDLDMLGAPHLTEAVQQALEQAPSTLVVDLSEVEFLASAGMAAIAAANELAGTSVRFAVVADGPATSRPLKLLGMGDLLPLYPTLGDALRALS